MEHLVQLLKSSEPRKTKLYNDVIRNEITGLLERGFKYVDRKTYQQTQYH